MKKTVIALSLLLLLGFSFNFSKFTSKKKTFGHTAHSAKVFGHPAHEAHPAK